MKDRGNDPIFQSMQESLANALVRNQTRESDNRVIKRAYFSRTDDEKRIREIRKEIDSLKQELALLEYRQESPNKMLRVSTHKSDSGVEFILESQSNTMELLTGNFYTSIFRSNDPDDIISHLRELAFQADSLANQLELRSDEAEK